MIAKPARGLTTISLHVEKANNIVLKIFDANGRLVTTLADQFVKPGSLELFWNTSGISNGLYTLQLVSGNDIETEKLMVMN